MRIPHNSIILTGEFLLFALGTAKVYCTLGTTLSKKDCNFLIPSRDVTNQTLHGRE
jgi:hypothetical protein